MLLRMLRQTETLFSLSPGFGSWQEAEWRSAGDSRSETGVLSVQIVSHRKNKHTTMQISFNSGFISVMFVLLFCSGLQPDRRDRTGRRVHRLRSNRRRHHWLPQENGCNCSGTVGENKLNLCETLSKIFILFKEARANWPLSHFGWLNRTYRIKNRKKFSLFADDMIVYLSNIETN